ncbi:hypothetical protein NDU88_001171 [Pleurodeles waltl]|uniref:Uncharacterized protein n=1 Tax=Pleurodeles waltl TaxID=8319 RepID=A0AAV7U6H5_PLEWA|nr:hypothetical protein NDU88_001171 [Pleurodeles waltl]
MAASARGRLLGRSLLGCGLCATSLVLSPLLSLAHPSGHQLAADWMSQMQSLSNVSLRYQGGGIESSSRVTVNPPHSRLPNINIWLLVRAAPESCRSLDFELHSAAWLPTAPRYPSPQPEGAPPAGSAVSRWLTQKRLPAPSC